jgi:hypothetical protein
MSIRKLAMLTAVAALGLLALGSSSASATTALRTDPGGALLSGSTTITNTSSGNAVLNLPGLGTVTCTNTKFDADANSNSSATTIAGTLTSLTFSTCSDTIPIITVTHCELDPDRAKPSVSISSTAIGGNVTINDAGVRCFTPTLNGFCYYTGTTASAVGIGNNAASTLTYTNVQVDRYAGATSDLGSTCGNNGNFSVTLNHIVQGGTNATVTITTA